MIARKEIVEEMRKIRFYNPYKKKALTVYPIKRFGTWKWTREYCDYTCATKAAVYRNAFMLYIRHNKIALLSLMQGHEAVRV